MAGEMARLQDLIYSICCVCSFRIDLEPCEMVLSMVSASLRVYKSTSSPSAGVPTDAGSADMEDGDESSTEYKSYLVIGTAYAMHDEDEPTKGRILVLACDPEDGAGTTQRSIRTVTELQVRGGIYSMCQFYEGRLLATVNSKTQMYQLVNEGTGIVKLAVHGVGHHGHILSLFVSSRANKMLGSEETKETPAMEASDGKKGSKEKEMLAIVGDLMRSISLVQYYPKHDTLEEVARDFNSNWTTSVAMLTDDVYLGGENWNNLFVLRRNTKAQSEEVRCRLDTVGEFHLGEMCNKFMSGSLVMPSSTSEAATSNTRAASRRSIASPKKGDSGKVPASPGGAAAAMRSRRPVVAVGSQTLFGTVDGTLGAILGLDGPTAAFFSCLERSMQKVIIPVGHFSHQNYRAFNSEQRLHPSHGFVDGDLVESFLDLDKNTMISVVQQMNWDGGWNIDDLAFSADSNSKESEAPMDDDQKPELSVDDVLAVVEEMTMLH
jgi:DNA damage-binding protein 1